MLENAIALDRVASDATRWAQRQGIRLGEVAASDSPSEDMLIFRVPIGTSDGREVFIIFQQDGSSQERFGIGIQGATGLRTSKDYSTALGDLQVTMNWIYAATNQTDGAFQGGSLK